MDSTHKECDECHGTGIMMITAAYLDRIDEQTIPCPQCKGSGIKQVEPLKDEAEIASP